MDEEVYKNRINRLTRIDLRGFHKGGFYSTRVLGAYSSDLASLAAFFSEPWKKLSPNINRADQGWLVYAAGFLLRAVGRLDEAVEPIRLGANMAVEQGDWTNSAVRMSNLSNCFQLSGHLQEAVKFAEEAELFAQRSHSQNQVLLRVALAADTRYQIGDVQGAMKKFQQAEAIQAQYGGFPYLGSLHGHCYCELLSREAETCSVGRDSPVGNRLPDN